MTRTPGLLLGAAGIAALIAACGSSSSTTSSTSSATTAATTASTSSTAAAGSGTVDATYAAAAAQICTTAEAQVNALGVPGDPTKATAADMPKWATFLAGAAQIHGQALQQIAALPPPTSGAADLVAASGLAVKVQTDLQTLATAAQGGDLNGFATGFAVYNQDNTAANTAFDNLGIKACGSGTSAATQTATTT